jgi:hypothetical protein
MLGFIHLPDKRHSYVTVSVVSNRLTFIRLQHAVGPFIRMKISLLPAIYFIWGLSKSRRTRYVYLRHFDLNARMSRNLSVLLYIENEQNYILSSRYTRKVCH